MEVPKRESDRVKPTPSGDDAPSHSPARARIAFATSLVVWSCSTLSGLREPKVSRRVSLVIGQPQEPTYGAE